MAIPAAARAFEKSGRYVNDLTLFSTHSEAPEASIIGAVCETLWARKGKRLRSHLVYWFGEMAGVAPERLSLYAWAAEVIHTATLLHDDVIDEADKRRGGASANRLYDNTLPILSGDYLLSDALQRVAQGESIELLRLLCQTVKDLSAGEALQYQMRYTIPSHADLVLVARLKTTALLSWCAQVGTVLSSGSERSAVIRFMDTFGLLFQFSDDLLDVIGSPTKGRWTDLKEGKLNLVTTRFVERSAELRQFTQAALEERVVPRALVERFEQVVATEAPLEEIRKELQALVQQAQSELLVFPPSALRESLHNLVQICADRCL